LKIQLFGVITSWSRRVSIVLVIGRSVQVASNCTILPKV